MTSFERYIGTGHMKNKDISESHLSTMEHCSGHLRKGGAIRNFSHILRIKYSQLRSPRETLTEVPVGALTDMDTIMITVPGTWV